MEVVMAAHVYLKYLGCICKDGIGTITNEAGNINSAKHIDIFDHNRWPVVGKFEYIQWSFKDGNVPVHVQTKLQKYINDVDCHDWSFKSPDLNIIEIIWRIIEIRLQRKQHTIHSKVDLIRPVTRI
jgi:hypothetical protein